jgi:poly-beta-1,6-N-acetyl-D-glucosamine synthase
LTYSIITTARNEAKYILRTLESVIHQSIIPNEWVIVNDGSSDATSEIVSRYSKTYSWIQLFDLYDFRPEIKSTGGRVGHILNVAVQSVKSDYDILIKVDADVEFDPDFFKYLTSEFEKDKTLGIASGHLIFNGKKERLDYRRPVVRGAVMAIRKEVFMQVNGFFESKGRGEDNLICIAARYYGWQTRTFPIFFHHLKPESSRHSHFHESLISGYYKGSIPYRFDYFILTLIKQLIKKPYIIGSIIQFVIYCYTRYLDKPNPFPDYVRIQMHYEQGQYLKNLFHCNL